MHRLAQGRSLIAILCCCLALGVLTCILPTQAKAIGAYTMDPVTIDAVLAVDGSLTVTSQRTFNFEGTSHGVYWNLPAGEYQGRTITPQVLSAGLITANNSFMPFEQQSSGAGGTYQILRGSSGLQAKLFNNVDGQSATYQLTYKLPSLATAWADCAELYWKFVSDGWDQPSQNVTCTILLPVPQGTTLALGQNVQAWGHATLDARVFQNQNAIVFSVPQVGTRDFAEARVLFPKSWLADAYTIDQNHQQEAQAQEATWAQEANAQRQRDRMLFWAAFAITIAVGALSVLLVLLWYKDYKKTHRPIFEDDYFRDLPSDDNPCVLGYLNGSNNSRSLSAELMRLIDKGAIEVASPASPTKPRDQSIRIAKHSLHKPGDAEDMVLIKNEEKAGKLTDPIDKAFIELIFDEFAEQLSQEDKEAPLSISLKELRKLAQKEPGQYKEYLDRFTVAIEVAARDKNFFADNRKTHRFGTGMLLALNLVVLLAACVLFGLFDVRGPYWAAILAPLAALVACAFCIAKERPLSQEAIELDAKTNALKRWLCNFTNLGEAAPQDVVLWNHLLVMATVLGVSKKVLEQLKVAQPQLIEDHDFIFYYPIIYGYQRPYEFYALFGTAAMGTYRASVFSSAASSMSSASGGAGGFSGGGGGGFGGGGGGGSF